MICGDLGSGQPWGDIPGPDMPRLSPAAAGHWACPTSAELGPLTRLQPPCPPPTPLSFLPDTGPSWGFPWEEALKPEELHTCILKIATPGHFLPQAFLDYARLAGTCPSAGLRPVAAILGPPRGAHDNSLNFFLESFYQTPPLTCLQMHAPHPPSPTQSCPSYMLP